jgi:glycosyltransferase involved in cell wall biosynthesis
LERTVSVQTSKPELEVLLPVHNEADSIESTVREIYEVLSLQVSLRFIICEDGSVDDTKDILRELSKSLPMNLILSEEPAFCRHDTGL